MNFIPDEPPIVLTPTTTLAGNINVPFSFDLSWNYFTDPDGDDIYLPFLVGPIDGELWPSFMLYDPGFRRITGYTTEEDDKKSWPIKVWTYDDVTTVEHIFAVDLGNCYYRCETCFGEPMDECNTCYEGYYFYLNFCWLACPDGTALVGDHCEACYTSCALCYGTA